MIRKNWCFYVKKMQKSIIVLYGILMLVVGLLGCTKKDEEQLMLLSLESDIGPVNVTDGQSINSSAEDTDIQLEDENFLQPDADINVVCVHVCGAVNNPGVYEVQEGSRIYQAIELAGGFTGDAAQDYVNLAQTVTDESQIVIPTLQEVEDGSVLLQSESAHQSDDGGLVNINTADVTRLCTLPGIGESKAEAIISYRKQIGQFETTEQIMEVEGIKSGMYSKIQDKICVK